MTDVPAHLGIHGDFHHLCSACPEEDRIEAHKLTESIEKKREIEGFFHGVVRARRHILYTVCSDCVEHLESNLRAVDDENRQTS